MKVKSKIFNISRLLHLVCVCIALVASLLVFYYREKPTYVVNLQLPFGYNRDATQAEPFLLINPISAENLFINDECLDSFGVSNSQNSNSLLAKRDPLDSGISVKSSIKSSIVNAIIHNPKYIIDLEGGVECVNRKVDEIVSNSIKAGISLIQPAKITYYYLQKGNVLFPILVFFAIEFAFYISMYAYRNIKRVN